MPILVTCRTCNRRFNAPDAAAGKKTNCPNCSDIIEIPSAAPAEEILDAEEELRPQPIDPGGAADLPPPAGSGEELRPCPMCGEMIQKAAVKCRFCGEIFDPLLKKTEKSAASSDEKLSTLEWVLAIVCSGIGCIVGIVWMIQGKPKGKKMFFVSLIANFAWQGLVALMNSVRHHGPR